MTTCVHIIKFFFLFLSFPFSFFALFFFHLSVYISSTTALSTLSLTSRLCRPCTSNSYLQQIHISAPHYSPLLILPHPYVNYPFASLCPSFISPTYPLNLPQALHPFKASTCTSLTSTRQIHRFSRNVSWCGL